MIDTIDPFETAVNLVLEEEGGLVHNPNDPGGLTKFGISQRAYPTLDIANLTVDDAKAIYFKDYWQPLLPYNLSERFMKVAFSTAINMGLSRCKGFLEASSGNLEYFFAQRMLGYVNDKNWPVFGKGWTRRLFHEALSA